MSARRTAYPYQPARHYNLRRDGEVVLPHATEHECWRFIHSTTSYSVDHALRWEGYELQPIPVVP